MTTLEHKVEQLQSCMLELIEENSLLRAQLSELKSGQRDNVFKLLHKADLAYVERRLNGVTDGLGDLIKKVNQKVVKLAKQCDKFFQEDEARLDKFDNRIDGITDGINKQIRQINTNFAELDERIGVVENQFCSLDMEVESLSHTMKRKRDDDEEESNKKANTANE